MTSSRICPFYQNGKCKNPNDPTPTICSWAPPKDYRRCLVYTLITNPSEGRDAIKKALGGNDVFLR